LDRSKAQLKIDQVQAPYYIEYRVNDVDDLTLKLLLARSAKISVFTYASFASWCA
jgi:hypothetical protein